jgi:hypothetical protein
MQRLAAALVWVAWPVAAPADDHPVVVELFTSQGCSTCPPADAILGELARLPDVIALGLHVDYWDYIGWTDTFAGAAFTARQQAYARAARERGVYTPQFIVAGVDAVGGADAMQLMAHLRHHAETHPAVDLDIRRTGGRLRIAARAAVPAARPLILQVVRYRPSATVAIGAGENAGREITYANIVTSWQQVADWHGPEPLLLEIGIADPEPVVVILQEPGPGRIVAAARAD